MAPARDLAAARGLVAARLGAGAAALTSGSGAAIGAAASGRLSLRRCGRVCGRDPRTPGWRLLVMAFHDRAPRVCMSIPREILA